MTDDQAALAKFDGTARLFSMPNLVFFPHVVQSLHIFESRYRQMAADAIADDQLIAIVLLRGDWENDYDASPEIETVACLGRITGHELMPDGRYNMRLRGIARVRIVEELSTDKLYRVARAEPILDVVSVDIQQLMALRRQLAAVVLSRFDPTGLAHAHLHDLFHGETPLGPLCDMLSYALPIELELKQLLLAEPHAHSRAEILTTALRLPESETSSDGVIQSPRKFPPDFSPN